MSIIQKYIVKEITKIFGMVLAAVVCVYVIADFFEKSDNFIKAGFSLGEIVTFFLLNIPMIVFQITPIGILLSVIIFFTLMNKNNELLALKSSGVSIFRLMKPVAVLGIAGGVALFIFSDVVVPVTTTKANIMWVEEIKKRSLVTSREKNIWIKGEQKITHIKYYNPTSKIAYGVTVNAFDETFQLIRKIDAEKGFFHAGQWVVTQALVQAFNAASHEFDIHFYSELAIDLDFVPEDLNRVIKKPAEMSFNELLEYSQRIEAEGYDATIYRVDLYAKPAYAFLCLIMCLVGLGLAVRQRHQSIFITISYGMLSAFLFWIFYSFCLSLGYGDMLPPLIAAWMANFVFLCLGFLILVHAE